MPAPKPITVKVYGRISYPNIFTPRKTEQPSDPQNYDATFLFDEEAQKMEGFKKLVGAVKTQIDTYFKGKMPEGSWMPIRKGEEKVDNDGNYRDGFGPGIRFVSAKNTLKPVVVGKTKNPLTGKFDPLTDPSDLPGGYYVNAMIDVLPFGHDAESLKFSKGKKGIKLKLGPIQLVKEGPRFDNRKSAEEAFDDINDGGTVDDVDNLLA